MSSADWETNVVRLAQLRFPKGSSDDPQLRKELALRRLILKDAFEAVSPVVAPVILLRLGVPGDKLTQSLKRMSSATLRQLEDILVANAKRTPVMAAAAATATAAGGLAIKRAKTARPNVKPPTRINHRTFRPAEHNVSCERKTYRGDMFEFCTTDGYKYPTFKAIERRSEQDGRRVLLQNEGQAFESQATKWEKKFCVPIGKRSFIPVVDRNGTVIAWFRGVFGNNLYTSVSEESSQSVPPDKVVYIPDYAPPAYGEVYKWTGLRQLGIGGSGGERYEVIFDINGNILDLKSVGAAGSRNWGPDGFFMEDDLFDKVTIVAGGAGLAKSLIVRVGRKGFKMLARVGAKESAESVDELAGALAGQLVPLARARGASRQLTGKEMQKFLRETYTKNPHLARLHKAKSMSGQMKQKELIEILEAWEHYTGKSVQIVGRGAVENAGAMGKAGFARNADTGKEVLAIEESVFKNTDELWKEVTHELAYDAVRSANGVPALGGSAANFPHNMSNELLELMIKEGPEDWLKVVGDLP